METINIEFKKVCTGEFDVYLNGDKTGYSIVNGSRGLTGSDPNMYSVVRPNGTHKLVGSLAAAKALVRVWLSPVPTATTPTTAHKIQNPVHGLRRPQAGFSFAGVC